MRIRMRVVVSLVALMASATVLRGSGTEPLSNIPAEQRDALTKRLGSYIEVYRGRNWDKLYDFVSDTGRGGATRQTFVAAMQSEHGTAFAQMPDLLEFGPDRAQKNGDGLRHLWMRESAARGHDVQWNRCVTHGVRA